MASKTDEAYYTAQEKESVTLKIRFSQFKKTFQPDEKRSHGNCLKWLTIIISILLMILGAICIICGIVYQTKYYPKLLFISKSYSAIVTFFIVLGVFMVIAGTCGIFCMIRKSYVALIGYLVILAFLIILHIVLGSFAFHNRSKADVRTKKALSDGYHNYYLISDAKDFMDWSQQRFMCCGEHGPKDYVAQKSTKAPHHSTTLKHTTTPVAATTIANTTTTKPPTTVANTTTAAPLTTVANTTKAAAPTTVTNTTTKAAQTTIANTTAAPTTTTAAKTTTAAPSTTAAKTTKLSTSTLIATTKQQKGNTTESHNIVNAAGGNALAFSGSGLPETCCRNMSSLKLCQNRPNDILKAGCYKKVDCFVKSVMASLGIFAFCMVALELVGLIVAAVDADRVKEEGSYDKF